MALEKAVLVNTVTGERFAVGFNPEEYTLQRDNNYAQLAVPGLRAPLLQFLHGQAQTLELELLIDTLEAHVDGSRRLNEAGADVRGPVGRITSLLEIDRTTHAPPVLLFAWASFSFTCVLSRATQRFTLFRPDGVPVRARLQVTFTEFTNAETEAKEVKRETADYTKVHLVTQGDRLDALAFERYGSAALWRPIALANGLTHPRDLLPGQRLLIPRLPFRDPETGEVHDR
jgi:nucleoid-associated protein YgaU